MLNNKIFEVLIEIKYRDENINLTCIKISTLKKQNQT